VSRATPPTPAILADFRQQYEAERLARLRRGFLWYTGISGTLASALAAFLLWSPVAGDVSRSLMVLATLALALDAAVFLVPFFRVLRAPAPPSRADLVRLISRVVTASLLIQFIPAAPLAAVLTSALRDAGSIGPNASIGPLIPLLLLTLNVHLSAALYLPLTPRESFRPLIPFLVLFTIATVTAPLLFRNESASMLVVALPMILGVGLPGLAVAWWRQSRFNESFTNRAVRERYGELSAELSTARRIHDRLFPAPVRDGPLRVEFAYEPMRQIGGDVLYVRRAPPGGPEAPLDLLLIDVTGHGIAAALAVNRLHAELNRIYGVDPSAAPGAVITALNSYVCLTLAAEGVFATAVCLRADTAANTLAYANAGHPPPFLSGGDATVPRRLDSTTFVLGAVDGDAFAADEAIVPFRPGDAVLAYSDGATEARIAGGRMLGIAGLESLAAMPDAPDAPDASTDTRAAALLAAVQRLRAGPPQDDMLIVHLARPAAAAPGPEAVPRPPDPAVPRAVDPPRHG